jgi:hypothetical protein
MVQNPRFELAVAAIIMANALVMSVQIQWQGLDLGHVLEYRGYTSTGVDTWPGAGGAFDFCDFVFGVIYLVELSIKVVGLKLAWMRDPWNYLDLMICTLWVVENTAKHSLGLPTQSAVLRVARLFRLLRLIKVLRTLNGFDSLYLLMTTLKGSLAVLGWSCVLLFVVQMMIAMVLWFVLKVAYFDQSSYPVDERREVFEYFGTFARVMLTMFELTLANWPPVCRLLVEYVSEWFMLFFIFHKLTIGFAVVGVINGVFMQETFKVASTDDRIMMRQRQREVKIHTEKMKKLFNAADESGDGVIDSDEFKAIIADPEINMWLASMDIPVRDPESLYLLLDVDGDGELTCEELVKGAMKLRGAAKSLDVLAIRRDMQALTKILVPEPAP